MQEASARWSRVISCQPQSAREIARQVRGEGLVGFASVESSLERGCLLCGVVHVLRADLEIRIIRENEVEEVVLPGHHLRDALGIGHQSILLRAATLRVEPFIQMFFDKTIKIGHVVVGFILAAACLKHGRHELLECEPGLASVFGPVSQGRGEGYIGGKGALAFLR